MGFFDHLQKGGGFSLQAKKPQVRQVVQSRPAAPSRPSPQTANKPSPRNLSAAPRNKTRDSASRSGSGDRDLPPAKRRLTPLRNRKRPTPEQRLASDDEEGSDTETSLELRKRAKTSEDAEPDYGRQVRSLKAFSADANKSLSFVHAAEITSVQKPGKFKPAFGNTSKTPEIFLQYPSATPKEKYEAVVPREKDEFAPLVDIVQVIETVSQAYVPDDQLDQFNNESTGIIRKVNRARSRGSESEFRESITEYNNAIERLQTNGSISKKLEATHRLGLPHVERILNQIYSRTVSPRVESLRQYENGTDNVYGELLPRFITNIFKQTGLKSHHVFVDLGSGVGNVVLQAALEIGCESWGCEMMQNACDLADLQQAEFKSRCRLWGIAPGKTHLVRGDFLQEQNIIDVLKRADVVLINNQAFTSELNSEITNHFLDMKEGCHIVSLKSFAPVGHQIQSRNLNSVSNLLSVKEHEYWSNSVSWTDAGGTYYIAKKDSSRLKKYLDGSV